jgi:hypothetical protein
MTAADVLLACFSALRLAEGAVIIAAALMFKRRVVLLYGVVVTLLCIPTAAVSVGVGLPPGPLVIISAGHAISLACVIAATLSSAGEIRRLLTILAEAGLAQSEGRWRP